MKVYCVFEGGGAKCVAHVGFLKAIEKHEGYHAEGFAGTSAGAIVAALAAAGWKGKELYDGSGSRPASCALQLLNRTYHNKLQGLAGFLPPSDWRKIAVLKKFLNLANSEEKGEVNGTERRKKYLKILIFGIGILLCLGVLFFSLHSAILGAFFLLIIMLSLAVIIFISSRYRGIAGMEQPIEFLELLLRHKVPRHSATGVTFEDLERETGHSLKIVAADLEDGNLKLFSREMTPDVVVSRAVAASAAIPLIFKPVEIDGRQYCDGGIVSNLPAWAFDRERLLDSSCLTITCEVSPPHREIRRPKLSGGRLIVRVAITTLFGGSSLNTRGMLRQLPIGFWSSNFRMLDFEKTEKHIETINLAFELAEFKIDAEHLHRVSIDAVYERINGLCKKLGVVERGARVAYARSVDVVGSDNAAHHLWNCRGYERYGDHGIVMPAGSLLHDTLVNEETVKEGHVYDLDDEEVKKRYWSLGNGSLSGMLADDRRWVAVIPVPTKSPERISVAVCVDGDRQFTANRQQFLKDIRNLLTELV